MRPEDRAGEESAHLTSHVPPDMQAELGRSASVQLGTHDKVIGVLSTKRAAGKRLDFGDIIAEARQTLPQ